jgi:hypothetical protein
LDDQNMPGLRAKGNRIAVNTARRACDELHEAG